MTKKEMELMLKNHDVLIRNLRARLRITFILNSSTSLLGSSSKLAEIAYEAETALGLTTHPATSGGAQRSVIGKYFDIRELAEPQTLEQLKKVAYD